MTLRQRFENKYEVDEESGCWIWTGYKNGETGQFRINGKTQLAHRVSYEIFIGKIPEESRVIHKCKNQSCVNPDHLITQTLIERFENKFIKLSNCWEWIEGKDDYGYGKFSMNSRDHKAHRVSYQLYVGSIPDGLLVCHRCDNPSCVNPDHLFLGTQSDNIMDATIKNRTHPNRRIKSQEIEMIKSSIDFGLTKKEVAEQFGISPSYVSYICNKK